MNFYDEREWRYISNWNEKTGKARTIYDLVPYVTGFGLNLDKKNIEDYNIDLKKLDKIKFSFSDINFIIVQTEDDINRICSIIDNIKGRSVNKDILKTKILKFNDIKKNI